MNNNCFYALPASMICAFVKRQKLKQTQAVFIGKTICKIVLRKICKTTLQVVSALL